MQGHDPTEARRWPQRPLGLTCAGVGVFLLSTDSYFARIVETTPWTTAFFVGAFSGVTSLAARSLLRSELMSSPADHRTQDSDDRRALRAASLLQAAMTLCFFLAVEHTAVSNVVVIIAAAPLITAFVAFVWHRENQRPRVWSAVVTSVVGIVVVMSGSFGGGTWSGDLFAVGAVSAFAISAVLLSKHPDVDRLRVVGFGGFIMAAITLIPATFESHPPSTWLALGAMGAVFGPLARFLLTEATRFAPAVQVSLFAPLETIFATLWAYLAFAEVPPLQTWLGGVIIFAGLVAALAPTRGGYGATEPA